MGPFFNIVSGPVSVLVWTCFDISLAPFWSRFGPVLVSVSAQNGPEWVKNGLLTETKTGLKRDQNGTKNNVKKWAHLFAIICNYLTKCTKILLKSIYFVSFLKRVQNGPPHQKINAK